MSHTTTIPFKQDGKRRYITRLDIEDSNAVSAFYRRFKHCFEHDPLKDYFYLIEEK
jgi:hypothetical protein